MAETARCIRVTGHVQVAELQSTSYHSNLILRVKASYCVVIATRQSEKKRVETGQCSKVTGHVHDVVEALHSFHSNLIQIASTVLFVETVSESNGKPHERVGFFNAKKMTAEGSAVVVFQKMIYSYT